MILHFTWTPRIQTKDPNVTKKGTICFVCSSPFESELFEPILRWDGDYRDGEYNPIYLHEACAIELVSGLTRDLFEIQGTREADTKAKAALKPLVDGVRNPDD